MFINKETVATHNRGDSGKEFMSELNWVTVQELLMSNPSNAGTCEKPANIEQ
jgi:hypothetical protein